MATTVARLQAILSADTRGFDMAMVGAEKRAHSLGGRLGGLAGIALKTAGIGGLGAIAVGLKLGIQEWSNQQKATAQTNAVLKSTGGIANVTTKQVQSLATSLMKKSGVDDEVVQSGENLLLTFTKVRNEVGKGNDIFTQATKLALDMSVRLNKDLNSSVLMLGKALQDPIKGLTALRRAGVDTSEILPKIKELIGGTGLTAEAAAKGIASAQKALDAANKSAASASRALQTAQDQQASAARGLASAQDQVTAATSRMTSAQDHLKDANQRLQDSQQKVKDSTLAVKDAKDKLRDAQNRARSAQEALTDARKRAADELQSLKDAAVDASLSERAATLAVQRAQENLAKVMADSTSTDLDKQEAILNLDEANQNLTESHKRATDAQKENDDAQKKGIDGTDAMTKAREDQLKAEKDVADAQKAVAKALGGVQKAQEGVAKAQRSQNAAQRQVAAAQRGQEAAQRGMAAAQDRVAAASRALSAAEENVAASNKKVADAQTALTKAQKAAEPTHVSSAKLLKAQKLILAELQVEFGGAAAAAGGTFAGQINIAKETVNNWLGSLVTDAIPTLQQFTAWLRDHWPEISAAMKKFWADVKPILVGFLDIIRVIYKHIHDHWSTIGPIVKAMANIVGSAMKILGAELKLIAALLKGDWSEAWVQAKALMRGVYDFIVGYFKPQILLLKAAFGLLSAAAVGVWNDIKDAAEKITKPFKAAAGAIQNAVAGLRQEFHTLWKIFDKILDGIKWLIKNAKKIGGVFGGIGGAIGGALDSVPIPGIGQGGPAGGGGGGGGGNMGSMIMTANAIDSQHFPYVWGGGHSPGTYDGPYDCSGAVSALLRSGGLLTGSRVSGDFMNYGKPGLGKHLSILANPEHVYAIINGHAWGTSGENPRGGAGWFNGGVRSGFAIRHPEGFDTGGWLKPGLTLALNNTGQPERVLGPGEGAGLSININGPVYGSKDQLLSMIQNAAAEFKRRNGRSLI